MIKLFEHPLSPYAQKVKIALIEKGIPFETEMQCVRRGRGHLAAAMSGRIFHSPLPAGPNDNPAFDPNRARHASCSAGPDVVSRATFLEVLHVSSRISVVRVWAGILRHGRLCPSAEVR